MYRKTCQTGLVWLGGNGARGCKGAKRGYFVLVHVAQRTLPPVVEVPQEAATTTTAAAAEEAAATSSQRNAVDTSDVDSNGSVVSTLSAPLLASSRAEEGDLGEGGQPLLTATSRYSMASRSFESLQGLVATPDRARRRDRDATPSSSGGGVGAEERRFGDGVGESFDGGGVGASRANRPRASSARHEEPRPAAAGLRRRGMSTTDAAILRTRSALSGGDSTQPGGGGRASGRARAWTGGGDETVLKGGGVAGVGAGGTYGTGSGGSAVFDRRPGDRSRGGLQRISPLWDTGKDGPLSQMPVPFDRVGRTWSRSFNVDAAKTGGPLETSGATLGVSVSALTGQFHRTRVVTLYPRLIVRNFLGFPLEVCEFFFLLCLFIVRDSRLPLLLLQLEQRLPCLDGEGFALSSVTCNRNLIASVGVLLSDSCSLLPVVFFFSLVPSCWLGASHSRFSSAPPTAKSIPPPGLLLFGCSCCWHCL